MPTPQPPLLQYEKNIASQAGEDGVVEFALGKLPACDKWCVEFGAWDGKYCSNTYALIQQRDYTGVLIECDAERCARLSATHAEKRIIALCRFVSFDGADTLDNILHGTPIPTDFDLLSVDIDGNDYHVWAALNSYRPKLVVIEYNPSIPNGIDFVQPRDNAVAQGSSLAALDKLAKSKQYRLIHATLLNAIFVDEKYFPLFGIENSDPADFRADLSGVTQLFQTYDGQIHLVGNRKMLWHEGAAMLPARMQAIPRMLRTYPWRFSAIQRLMWKAYHGWLKWTGRDEGK
jgi:hypothetical protein